MPGTPNRRHPSIAQCFGGQITGDQFDRLCEMLGKARKRPLTDTERTKAHDRFEELAAQFRMLQRRLKSGQTPTAIRNALDRLETTSKRFMLALDGIDRPLWLSLDMRLKPRPKGFTSDISDYVFGDDAASPEVIFRHFEIVAALGRAAREKLDAMADTKAKPAPRKYVAVRWLARELAPFYREATGRPANANYSPRRKHKLGKRASPFVRFVGKFIKPFARELYSPGLGEAIRDALGKPARRRGN